MHTGSPSGCSRFANSAIYEYPSPFLEVYKACNKEDMILLLLDNYKADNNKNINIILKKSF